jgi:hypothetical protein
MRLTLILLEGHFFAAFDRFYGKDKALLFIVFGLKKGKRYF